MIIHPMMRGGAVALVLATAMLVQGCASSTMPTQQAMLSSSDLYSGTAWYADLSQVMTSDQGGE